MTVYPIKDVFGYRRDNYVKVYDITYDGPMVYFLIWRKDIDQWDMADSKHFSPFQSWE